MDPHLFGPHVPPAGLCPLETRSQNVRRKDSRGGHSELIVEEITHKYPSTVYPGKHRVFIRLNRISSWSTYMVYEEGEEYIQPFSSETSLPMPPIPMPRSNAGHATAGPSLGSQDIGAAQSLESDRKDADMDFDGQSTTARAPSVPAHINTDMDVGTTGHAFAAGPPLGSQDVGAAQPLESDREDADMDFDGQSTAARAPSVPAHINTDMDVGTAGPTSITSFPTIPLMAHAAPAATSLPASPRAARSNPTSSRLIELPDTPSSTTDRAGASTGRGELLMHAAYLSSFKPSATALAKRPSRSIPHQLETAGLSRSIIVELAAQKARLAKLDHPTSVNEEALDEDIPNGSSSDDESDLDREIQEMRTTRTLFNEKERIVVERLNAAVHAHGEVMSAIDAAVASLGRDSGDSGDPGPSGPITRNKSRLGLSATRGGATAARGAPSGASNRRSSNNRSVGARTSKKARK